MRKFLSMAYLLYLSVNTKGTGISEEKRSIGASSSLSPVQVMLEIRPIADRAMNCDGCSELSHMAISDYAFTALILSCQQLLPFSIRMAGLNLTLSPIGGASKHRKAPGWLGAFLCVSLPYDWS
jgi:hypothetical protein